MIFVPEKEKCLIWNDKLKNEIFIIYQFNDRVRINFRWHKCQNDVYDPFYLCLEEIRIQESTFENVIMPVFKCLEPACEASPQLRYNRLIKKWFVACPSSMICTKDDDQDELELFKNKKFTEDEGFYNNPVLAILAWNNSIATCIVENCKKLMEVQYEAN